MGPRSLSRRNPLPLQSQQSKPCTPHPRGVREMRLLVYRRPVQDRLGPVFWMLLNRRLRGHSVVKVSDRRCPASLVPNGSSHGVHPSGNWLLVLQGVTKAVAKAAMSFLLADGLSREPGPERSPCACLWHEPGPRRPSASARLAPPLPPAGSRGGGAQLGRSPDTGNGALCLF